VPIKQIIGRKGGERKLASFGKRERRGLYNGTESLPWAWGRGGAEGTEGRIGRIALLKAPSQAKKERLLHRVSTGHRGEGGGGGDHGHLHGSVHSMPDATQRRKRKRGKKRGKKEEMCVGSCLKDKKGGGGSISRGIGASISKLFALERKRTGMVLLFRVRGGNQGARRLTFHASRWEGGKKRPCSAIIFLRKKEGKKIDPRRHAFFIFT